MKRSGSTLRWSALLGAGALVMHELQYRTIFGADADAALAAHGHAYLSWALALVVVLTSVAALRLLAEVGGARREGLSAARRRYSVRREWTCSSAALAVTYLVQEVLEGALAAGHPGLLHVVGAHHGWLVLIVAVTLGGLIALLMRGADAVLVRAALSARARALRRPDQSTPRPPARLRDERLAVLARHLARRAPPAAPRLNH